ncbi:hydroxymethylpyrimidine/phosphomethylpyrimidine kinase [Pedobacter africanus]|uniref:hydroxymethylpyrimidine kinase n=1 Tax=Pedobacter africanus TaxID=151894 RepID=A0A1W2CMN1_9SPHI|nr:hydroxymethylpyrimidine/phosphomethylpyrimidine kinase [Pedobacter africanus]SMC86244.1 hydroxymethylpyrimidine/phosphomethylpyrimidine kinase [Pedobacter africanus]
MQQLRPYVMSLAGFDPSAGAGILADIKCFEQLQVYGFGVCTALTIQTDDAFLKNDWLDARQIIDQTVPLLDKFEIKACKIGLIKDLDTLHEVLDFLKLKAPAIKIVLDPVWKASTGYTFHHWDEGLKKMIPVLNQLDLITPNYPEMQALAGEAIPQEAAKIWSAYCPVLLKGGHISTAAGTDYLFEARGLRVLDPDAGQVYQKHGSGCVLSAVITAELAKGSDLYAACLLAKKYIEQFLNSSPSLLGYHHL